MSQDQIAFSELFTDLVIDIMALAGNPGECGEYIATQVRSLIGVRTVLILQCDRQLDDDVHRVVAVVPERRRALGETPELNRLANMSHHMDKATYIGPQSPPGSGWDLLQTLGIGESVVIPLCYSGNRAGVMLLLDLMDKRGTGTILRTLDKLAPVLALILRNASLYSGLEEQVAQRTNELMKANEAITESEERYALALRGTNDGIWDWNLRTGEVYFSSRWKEIIGYGQDEIPNEFDQWKTRLHPDDVDQAIHATQRCASGEAPSFEVEFRLRHKDGGYRWILGRGASLKNEQGEVVRMAGAHTDITERGRMMDVMLQTEKMMSVGGLAAGMAHEINNPLSGILQNVQVMARRLTMDTPANIQAANEAGCSLEAIRSYMEKREILASLDAIRETGCRAARIVSSMLEFSRASTSNNTCANINQLLDKSTELCATDYDLKKKYDFRNIRVVKEYDSNLPAVPCSDTQIQQVFMNLLANAAQAMTDTPAPAITLRTATESAHVRVEIEDNGPGMPPEVRKRAFEPFFTTKPVGEGTGLGLSVSYFIIVNNHHGDIAAQSVPGGGTRVVIRLPLAQASATDVSRNPASS
ncbi:MAG: PAS/PAC sensor signal transduction histidine [Desulfovibrionaceae bacterium]|nr:MAG: PAS/PAC sensor signal transduction histidine [Desulfovibrionaceae bacterium]